MRVTFGDDGNDLHAFSLLVVDKKSTPFAWVDILHRLREGPSMAREVQRGVLALSIGIGGRRIDDACSRALGRPKMRVRVLDAHHHCMSGARRGVDRAGALDQNNRAAADTKLYAVIGDA